MSFARQSKGLVACQYFLPNELLPPRSGNCAYALQILRSKASAGCRRVVYGSFSQRCTKLWCDTLLHGATFMLGLWHDGSLMVRRFIALTWLVRFSYSVRKCFVFVIFHDGQTVRGCWGEFRERHMRRLHGPPRLRCALLTKRPSYRQLHIASIHQSFPSQ